MNFPLDEPGRIPSTYMPWDEVGEVEDAPHETDTEVLVAPSLSDAPPLAEDRASIAAASTVMRDDSLDDIDLTKVVSTDSPPPSWEHDKVLAARDASPQGRVVAEAPQSPGKDSNLEANKTLDTDEESSPSDDDSAPSDEQSEPVSTFSEREMVLEEDEEVEGKERGSSPTGEHVRDGFVTVDVMGEHTKEAAVLEVSSRSEDEKEIVESHSHEASVADEKSTQPANRLLDSEMAPSSETGNAMSDGRAMCENEDKDENKESQIMAETLLGVDTPGVTTVALEDNDVVMSPVSEQLASGKPHEEEGAIEGSVIEHEETEHEGAEPTDETIVAQEHASGKNIDKLDSMELAVVAPSHGDGDVANEHLAETRFLEHEDAILIEKEPSEAPYEECALSATNVDKTNTVISETEEGDYSAVISSEPNMAASLDNAEAKDSSVEEEEIIALPIATTNEDVDMVIRAPETGNAAANEGRVDQYGAAIGAMAAVGAAPAAATVDPGESVLSTSPGNVTPSGDAKPDGWETIEDGAREQTLAAADRPTAVGASVEAALVGDGQLSDSKSLGTAEHYPTQTKADDITENPVDDSTGDEKVVSNELLLDEDTTGITNAIVLTAPNQLETSGDLESVPDDEAADIGSGFGLAMGAAAIAVAGATGPVQSVRCGNNQNVVDFSPTSSPRPNRKPASSQKTEIGGSQAVATRDCEFVIAGDGSLETLKSAPPPADRDIESTGDTDEIGALVKNSRASPSADHFPHIGSHEKSAVKYEDIGDERPPWYCTRRFKLLVVLSVIIALIIGITVPLVSGGDGGESEEPVVPKTEMDYALDVMMSVSDVTTLNDLSSPQYAAMNWILNADSVASLSLPPTKAEETILLQRYVLAVLYFSTDGDEWTARDGWLQEEREECAEPTWQHLACENGEVVSIDARSAGVGGRLPSELNGLISLSSLSLFRNSLTGIAEGFGPRTMVNLDLGENDIGGTIPPSLYRMLLLQSFYLDKNNFSGTISPEISNLNQLRELSLLANRLTGTVATQFLPLQDLELLALDRNELEGNLETIIEGLTNLGFLSFRGTPITGTIPPEIGNYTSLGGLDLGKTSLSGIIPSEVGLLSSLTLLYLDEAGFSGPIPSEIANLINIETLFLDGNDLEGSVPPEMCDFPDSPTIRTDCPNTCECCVSDDTCEVA